MKSACFRLRPLAVAAGTLCFASCNLPQPQVDTVRHFTLSTASTAQPMADAATVRSVRLAGHLRSRSMAVRLSENEVTYLEEMRWAEPLDEALTQLLRNRLRQVGGAATITVQIERCELVRPANNSVQLHATYTVAAAGRPDKSATFAAGARPWDGRDPADLVGLIREAANELAEALAAAAVGT